MVTQGKIMYWTSFKELAETPFESTVSIYIYILQQRHNVRLFKFSVIEMVFISLLYVVSKQPKRFKLEIQTY